MQTDFFTDRIIQLMRDVFARETLNPERRTRIYARVTSNPRVKGMELWATPATPFDEPSVELPVAEGDQLWLFPDIDVPSPPIGSTMSPLLQGYLAPCIQQAQSTTTLSEERSNLIIEESLLD